jgi:hypothetical protein
MWWEPFLEPFLMPTGLGRNVPSLLKQNPQALRYPPAIFACDCVCVTLRAHEITAIFVNGLLCIPGTQMTLLGVTLGRSTYQFGVPICLGQFTWSWTPCRQRTSSFLAGYKIWWSHENRQKLRSFSPSTNPYIQFNWLYHYLHTGE